MPPPLSSLCGRRSASRCRADRACRRQRSSRFPTLNTFPRSPLQQPDALTPRWVKRPGDLDLLTLKMVPQSWATWATSVPILVFLGLSVLDLGPMYVTDRRHTASSLNAPPIRGGGIIKTIVAVQCMHVMSVLINNYSLDIVLHTKQQNHDSFCI